MIPTAEQLWDTVAMLEVDNIQNSLEIAKLHQMEIRNKYLSDLCGESMTTSEELKKLNVNLRDLHAVICTLR